MDWQVQLREIVEQARRTPTFGDWLAARGYADMPAIGNPLILQSVMRSLYRRYLNEYPEAA